MATPEGVTAFVPVLTAGELAVIEYAALAGPVGAAATSAVADCANAALALEARVNGP